MLGEITKVQNVNPANDLSQEQVLVIMTKPGQAHSPWIVELEESAYPTLTVQDHYLELKCGFFAEHGEKPWILVNWQQDGGMPLERRWLARKITDLLKQRAIHKHLAFWLEPDFLPEQLVMVEDIQMTYMESLYDKNKVDSVQILTPEINHFSEVDPYRKLRQSYQLGYRKWVNENPDELTSIEIGKRLKDFAKSHDCEFHSMDEKELKENQMNLLLAVGQASKLSPSRLHLVTHTPKGDSRKPLLLVGKGVTFDTGGINVKHHDSHVNCMKNDMGGAALMSNIFMALVASGFDHPLVLAIPSCENLVAEKSMKPGSIIRSRNGKSVMIEHTDAEGRLILADAISYCHETIEPKQTIVAATLTTAVMRQFSGFYTAVHFADRQFQSYLAESGDQWGENFTHWGYFIPFKAGNYSNAADLTNMGRLPAATTGAAGSNVAAHFLREFATQPLIHFDIFASTWNWSGQYPGAHYGATGAPFNSLFSMLMEHGADWLDGKN